MMPYEERLSDVQLLAKAKKTLEKSKLEKKRFMYILFYIPAFLPLLFHFYCLGGEEHHLYFHSIIGGIQVLQDVTSISEPMDICVIHSGYIFSLAYLVIVCVFVYDYHIKNIERFGNYEGEWKGYLIASLIFTALFIFQNFVDISSGSSQKYIALRVVSFKFWPLFYLYFVMFIYCVAFSVSGFLIKSICRKNKWMV